MAVGQLGWVAGPLVTTLFAIVNFYTSDLLFKCYRSGDPVTGQKNYTYMDSVEANLGKPFVLLSLFGYFGRETWFVDQTG